MTQSPPKLIDTLLLLALPASGKSEVRRYLAHQSGAQCQSDFHMGPTVQLDDYPYVHMMRRVSQELRRRGQDPIFFVSDEDTMLEPRDWGTLIELLNEDYDDLRERRRPAPASAAQWLFDRYEAARQKVGARPGFSLLSAAVRAELAAALEDEAAQLLRDKVAGIPDDLTGKTVVIEFARGGAHGSSMPLHAPFGYRYSLGRLSPAILARSSVLYVWVTPEESRRKNHERTDPNDPGSILHHGVPLKVMMDDYGCDDMEWLLSQSDRPGTVRVEAGGRTYYLKVARFDNRKDKTTFVRADRAAWKEEDIRALHEGLAGAFAQLV
jgi:hypothetical protein